MFSPDLRGRRPQTRRNIAHKAGEALRQPQLFSNMQCLTLPADTTQDRAALLEILSDIWIHSSMFLQILASLECPSQKYALEEATACTWAGKQTHHNEHTTRTLVNLHLSRASSTCYQLIVQLREPVDPLRSGA